MQYIIVQPEGGLDSLTRTQSISEQLYYISVPAAVRADYYISRYVFGWIQHPEEDLYALQISDLDYEIYVHPDNDLTELLALFPEVSEAEKAQLSAYIESEKERRFPFQNIIPSTATVRDEAYMDAQGWFPPEPES